MAALAAWRHGRVAGGAHVVVAGEIDQLAAADHRAVVGDALVDAEIGIAQLRALQQIQPLRATGGTRETARCGSSRRGFPRRRPCRLRAAARVPRYFSTAAITCRVVSSSGRISWGNRPPKRSSSEARISIRSRESRPASAMGESSVIAGRPAPWPRGGSPRSPLWPRSAGGRRRCRRRPPVAGGGGSLRVPPPGPSPRGRRSSPWQTPPLAKRPGRFLPAPASDGCRGRAD